MNSVLIGIEGDIYDVTEYIALHPGEGIRNTYLRSYHRHDVTDEFDRMHMTDEPFDIIAKAKKDGYDDGIYYVCPYFFVGDTISCPLSKYALKRKPRIPKYFHFFPHDPHGLAYMKKQDSCTFFLRKSYSDTHSCLSITYKNEDHDIKHLKLTQTEKGWSTKWKQTLVSKKTIEEVVTCLLENNHYKSLKCC